MSNVLKNDVENDIKGSCEKELEEHALTKLKELQNNGKITDQELKTLYNTNFKNILNATINSNPVLERKKEQIDNITKKLIMISLSKQKSEGKKTETREQGWLEKGLLLIPNGIRKTVYLGLGIDDTLNKNSKTKNVVKGVIDELMSIPEILAFAISNPIDFIKSLSALFKKETRQQIANDFTAIGKGIDTPEKAYQTGRSGMMIVLTVLPGVAGSKIASLARGGVRGVRTAARMTKNTAGLVVEKGVKETAKQSTKKAINVAKNSINTTKEVVKKVYNKVTSINNVNSINKISKSINKLKNSKQGLSQSLATASDEPAKKAIKEQIKNINKQLTAEQAKLNGLYSKTNLTPKQIKYHKGLNTKATNLTKKGSIESAKKLSNKAKDILPNPLSASVIKTNARNGLKNIPAVSKNYLGKGLNHLKNGIKNNLILNNSIKSFVKYRPNAKKFMMLEKQLTRILKSGPGKGKTLLEYAQSLGTSNKWAKGVLNKYNVMKSMEPSLKAYNQAIKNSINQLTGAGFIVGTNHVRNMLMQEKIVEYVNIVNSNDIDIYIENYEDTIEDSSVDGLDSGSTEINIDEMDNILDKLSEEELKITTITITGKASKTGTKQANQRIAFERAERAESALINKYPGLDTKNITKNTSLQSKDSTDSLENWQGVSLSISVPDQSFSNEYANIINSSNANDVAGI